MECPICYEESIELITFSCTHSICIHCYQKLLQQETDVTCPFCRTIIDIESPPIAQYEHSYICMYLQRYCKYMLSMLLTAVFFGIIIVLFYEIYK